MAVLRQEAFMQVSKWGDSLAVRLPKELVEQMGLAVGDELKVIDVKGRTIVVEKDLRKQQALESLAAMKVKLPADYKFDRGEANDR
jgi:antitoxin MazE